MFGRRYVQLAILLSFLIFLAGIVILYHVVSGIFTSADQNYQEEAKKLSEWEKSDSYLSPEDGIISKEQLDKFLKVNRELSSFIFKVRQQFEENRWQIAFDIIRMHPEWIAAKYRALEKCHLSPKEYDWIVDRVIDFWVYRWKEESVERLNNFGWNFEEFGSDSTKPVNYQLLLEHEEDLNLIFDILWPEKPSHTIPKRDSMPATPADTD